MIFPVLVTIVTIYHKALSAKFDTLMLASAFTFMTHGFSLNIPTTLFVD